ncbi:MAG TPA: hypothetical protein PKO06_14085, partial [Candidatus Ozemobacteraceae bacterium]|nr:hypothetical protein [Candidatus Ozemobacteraceae bacterium]
MKMPFRTSSSRSICGRQIATWSRLTRMAWLLFLSGVLCLPAPAAAQPDHALLQYCPAEYHAVSIAELATQSVSPIRVSVRPVSDFITPATLAENNPLDVPLYLAKRIPKPIRRLLASPSTHLILLPDLLDRAIPTLRQQGFSSGAVFLADLNTRVQVAYLVFSQPRGMTVVVTHLFGQTRLEHLAWQYATFLFKAGRSLDAIEIWETQNPDTLARELCFDALQDLDPDQPTVICSGYFGSLKHVLADFELFHRRHPGSLPTLAQLDHLRAIEQPGQITTTLGGNPYFPWWQTFLTHPDGRRTRIIGFRNLYGDQTGTLFSCLLEKGFRRFVLFSNGGGLAHTSLRTLYAPGVARDGQTTVPLRNLAIRRYPARALVSVPSLLVETSRWLEEHRFCSLVDVEGVHAARALAPYPDSRLYYAILVSDRPGHIDITQKEEDAPDS